MSATERLSPISKARWQHADRATALTDLLRSHRTHLAHASAWFPQLRAARRRARITDGNAQELYFPRAFELAGLHGAPGPDAAEICDEVIREVHGEVSVRDLATLLDALPADPFPDWGHTGPAPTSRSSPRNCGICSTPARSWRSRLTSPTGDGPSATPPA